MTIDAIECGERSAGGVWTFYDERRVIFLIDFGCRRSDRRRFYLHVPFQTLAPL